MTEGSSNDGIIQQMISKGVSQDIRRYPQRFQKCTCCGVAFTQKTKRILLDCGHFICIQCLQTQERCFYPECKNTNPSIKNYGLNTNQSITENGIFGFRIRTAESLHQIRKEVNGSTTIRSLLQDPQFKAFINQSGQNKVNLVFGIKSIKLQKIIDTKIIDLKNDCKIISKKDCYNPIIIVSRYLGG